MNSGGKFGKNTMLNNHRSRIMYSIRFNGWKPGAEKLSLIKLLNERCSIPLIEAKEIKDRIVEFNDATIEV
ncbi:hypothetical protein DXN05_09940 [Deminuibacter soli]|uniref:Uncharacterized protein n=1 Tax=Deminuibacter soli TaxID=2291815 RepID=A0A3E1NMB6_9BACT|nr:hypothetical protein DXN05_09940 [Deminuibacter soli]